MTREMSVIMKLKYFLAFLILAIKQEKNDADLIRLQQARILVEEVLNNKKLEDIESVKELLKKSKEKAIDIEKKSVIDASRNYREGIYDEGDIESY